MQKFRGGKWKCDRFPDIKKQKTSRLNYDVLKTKLDFVPFHSFLSVCPRDWWGDEIERDTVMISKMMDPSIN